MLFNQRNGYAAPLKELAPDELTADLRNSFWNEVTDWVQSVNIRELCHAIWKQYYKKPTDKIPYVHYLSMDGYFNAWTEIRTNFFKYEWSNVYDFLEFLLLADRYGELEKGLKRVLSNELAPYRLINKQFIQITDPVEISSLSESIGFTDKFRPVSDHIKSALGHLSNRDNPDYRNSIKESISAVEAMAKIISNKPKATLDDALKALAASHALHGGLKNGYSNLYGYTNDANGIRHSLLSESNLTQADAKYFLISCSAFVNYLKTISRL